MNRDLTELTDLTAETIAPERVTNPALRNIISGVRRSARGQFMFKSRHHIDKSYSQYNDEFYGERISDYWYRDHTDHADHQDHTESEHTDRGYSEGSWHTESGNSHEDETSRSHTDRAQ